MEEKRVKELALQAAKIRKTALKAIEAAQSGHVGGSFSVADILTVLYFDKMNIDPKDPKNPDRDRFVLSKGHCTPTMYATLALKGYFPVEDLKTFRNVDSYLSGHVDDESSGRGYVGRISGTGTFRGYRNGAGRESR